MFTIRNPKYEVNELFNLLFKFEFDQVKGLKNILKGRSLWCASQISEVFPKENI